MITRHSLTGKKMGFGQIAGFFLYLQKIWIEKEKRHLAYLRRRYRCRSGCVRKEFVFPSFHGIVWKDEGLCLQRPTRSVLPNVMTNEFWAYRHRTPSTTRPVGIHSRGRGGHYLWIESQRDAPGGLRHRPYLKRWWPDVFAIGASRWKDWRPVFTVFCGPKSLFHAENPWITWQYSPRREGAV